MAEYLTPYSHDRQEESQASQQGPLHLQDVPPRRLRHPRPEEPSGRGGAAVSDPVSCPPVQLLFTWGEGRFQMCGFLINERVSEYEGGSLGFHFRLLKECIEFFTSHFV